MCPGHPSHEARCHTLGFFVSRGHLFAVTPRGTGLTVQRPASSGSLVPGGAPGAPRQRAPTACDRQPEPGVWPRTLCPHLVYFSHFPVRAPFLLPWSSGEHIPGVPVPVGVSRINSHAVLGAIYLSVSPQDPQELVSCFLLFQVWHNLQVCRGERGGTVALCLKWALVSSPISDQAGLGYSETAVRAGADRCKTEIGGPPSRSGKCSWHSWQCCVITVAPTAFCGRGSLPWLLWHVQRFCASSARVGELLGFDRVAASGSEPASTFSKKE